MTVRNPTRGRYMRVAKKEATAFLKCYTDNHIEVGYDERFGSYKKDLEYLKRR